MDEKDLQEFSLEDIMKEFGDTSEAVAEKTPEEILQEVEAEVRREQGIPEVAEEPEEPVATGDTVRFEAICETVATDATIRLDKIPDTHGAVRNAQPIVEEEEEETSAPVQEENTEPFSEQWEPEYDQPIGEYVPPRPILFHPRSRLRELKRKLVEGPEKMYYALTEKGLGKLQVAIFISVLVVLISAAATALYAFGMVQENRMRLMVFGQFLAMLVAALLGSYQLLEGITDLLHKRFSLNTVLVFTFIICCIDGVLCLQQLRVPCCAAFSLQVSMSLWNAYQKRNTKLGQLDTMRKAVRLDSISATEGYYDDVKGFLRGEGQVEDFMETLDQPCRLEKTVSVYGFVALCVSMAVGIVAGVLHGISTGIQVAAVTTLAAIPASMFVTLSRPMAVLERRHHALGTVLCGWQGVEGLSGKAVFPVSHDDLFPVGSVKMNGVKFYGNRQPDEIIAYAVALVAEDGGSLEPLFTHLLDSRNGMHYTVKNFNPYGGGGIGGEINGEPVLAGSIAFLRSMGVEVPEGIRVSQAVGVAIDGELCGLFAIAYEKDRASSAGIATLCGYRSMKPILTGSDFMLTEDFLRSQFDINPNRVILPECSVRKELREKAPEPGSRTLALITGEGLAPFAYAVTGARSLKSASTAGVVVHMVGGILGIAMMLVLGVLGATELLTPASMFLYELLWMVPGLLITEWTRSI